LAYDKAMRCLAVITMLVFAMTLAQPVAAQSFKPNFGAGFKAHSIDDYATALKHLRPLAEQGNAGAQYWLGRMYREGKGVTRNNKKAVRWWRKSAKQGDSSTQFYLGEMYRVGWGVLQDLVDRF
jgi:TPR repeat protein